MRILHVVTLIDDQHSYGGPLSVALMQCRTLRRRGHDARILAGWRGVGTPPKILDDVPLHLFPVKNVVSGRFPGLLSISLLTWLRQALPSIDIGHLHLARDLIPLTAGTLFESAGVPYITQTHGMIIPDTRPTVRLLDRTLTQMILRRAAHRLVLTPDEHDAVAAVTGQGYDLDFLPNGVDIPTASMPAANTMDVG